MQRPSTSANRVAHAGKLSYGFHSLVMSKLLTQLRTNCTMTLVDK